MASKSALYSAKRGNDAQAAKLRDKRRRSSSIGRLIQAGRRRASPSVIGVRLPTASLIRTRPHRGVGNLPSHSEIAPLPDPAAPIIITAMERKPGRRGYCKSEVRNR
jgi:hypothetical protein